MPLDPFSSLCYRRPMAKPHQFSVVLERPGQIFFFELNSAFYYTGDFLGICPHMGSGSYVSRRAKDSDSPNEKDGGSAAVGKHELVSSV
jgi:hypothetical protein